MHKQNNHKSAFTKSLFVSGNEQLEKIHRIIEDAVAEEETLSNRLLKFEDLHPPFTSRLADHIARFGGSWKFILSFGVLMLAWILVNVYVLSKPFDPFPFILLNLLLSTIAALQAPLIMMSQNRKEEKDRERAVNDYMINLKAEIEVRNLHGKIDLLITEQMKTLFAIQEKQVELLEDTRREILAFKKNTHQHPLT